jgi:hypothetical protein
VTQNSGPRRLPADGVALQLKNRDLGTSLRQPQKISTLEDTPASRTAEGARREYQVIHCIEKQRHHCIYRQ